MSGRVGILGLFVAGLAVAAAVAAPGTRSYEGGVTLEPGSHLSFDVVKKESGKKKLKNLTFDAVPAGCSDGSVAQISGTSSGSVRLKGRKFNLNDSDALREISFTGQVKSRGRKASGGLRFSGSFEVEGQTLECDTAPRSWSADRV